MTVEHQISSVVAHADDAPARSKPWFYRSFLKRPLDLFLILLATPVIVPLIFLLALLVKRDGGNAFYSQERVGRNGKIYRIWKLRSMVSDADEVLPAYLAENPNAQAEWEENQKLRHDPRITRLGHVLRRCSLDELPQLWNVVRGDMSLIGPRPMMPSQQIYYTGDAYYDLRPGITGYWQVAGRNRTSFSARAMYDDVYDRNLSLGSDIGILWRTVGVVLRATGC
ncbi:sugar transferase [Paracoccus homiensis]|uniref:Sugar transferase involved in LPS biosynthesis (Colanic, teichoic acid) n=1 Tax=Paracoccus homiensis TaxID=364199 RepID=A0A1I0CNM8_9RHOB|nr:sugar transferase [Paracoccus homiensis]SET20850.1 Sugar transferase involved in LPS biosynthesis (colanic, teichoic acid) [Paracoccus homiensis]